MKRILSLVLGMLIVFVVSTAFASPQTIDIENMTVSELQSLQKQVDEQLQSLGAYYIDIGKNETGQNVLNLQKRLITLGYLSGTSSGKWDSASQKAMKAFEGVTGLTQDGMASVDDQEAIFSDTALVKPTPAPTPTPSPKPTPKPTPTPDPLKAYGKYDYKAVFRNPENYMGEKVKVTGRVVQVLGSRSDGFTIRLATKGRWNNVIMLLISSSNSPEDNIIEGDKLVVYGTIADNYTYTSTLGAEITVPMVNVDTAVIK